MAEPQLPMTNIPSVSRKPLVLAVLDMMLIVLAQFIILFAGWFVLPVIFPKIINGPHGVTYLSVASALLSSLTFLAMILNWVFYARSNRRGILIIGLIMIICSAAFLVMLNTFFAGIT